VQGNSAQMRDPAFMNELKAWIRFNDASALATMDGLSSRSTGNPSLPSWLARLMLPIVMTEKGENDKYAKQLRSSAGVAVFVSERDDKAHWVEAGRACQRFALKATALGLKYAFVNQPVEVPELRRQLMTHLAIGDAGRISLSASAGGRTCRSRCGARWTRWQDWRRRSARPGELRLPFVQIGRRAGVFVDAFAGADEARAFIEADCAGIRLIDVELNERRRQPL
jgi:hypothetical protein